MRADGFKDKGRLALMFRQARHDAEIVTRTRPGPGRDEVGLLSREVDRWEVDAAAGIVALRTMVDRLATDHANARRLAEGISRTAPLSVDLSRVRTNIVLVAVNARLTAPEFTDRLKQEGVLTLPTGPSTIRMVTHRHITAHDVDMALEAIRRTATAFVQPR